MTCSASVWISCGVCAASGAPKYMEWYAAFGLILLMLAVRTLVDVRVGLYAHDWRFASIPDLQRIVSATLAGSVIAASIFYGLALLVIVMYRPAGV